jgi:signal transduction histidine kinase
VSSTDDRPQHRGRVSAPPPGRAKSSRRPPQSQDAGTRVAYQSAARILLQSLDYESTLAAVAGLALPDIGSWSIVDVCERSGAMRRLAVVHPDPAMQLLARRLQDSWPPQTEDPIGAPVVMRTGATKIVSDVSDAMLVTVARDEENLALLRELGIGSFIVVPLTARQEVLGAITFVSKSPGRTYTGVDIGLAEGLAALGAVAIERAHLYEESEEARARALSRAEVAERQQRDLEQIMEIQARLVRGFSHDVKNPLGAAQGYAQLLEDGLIESLTPKQRESVIRIGASIGTALTLIDDLVEYAKSKMGKVEIQSQRTNVTEIAREILEEYRAQIEAAGLAIAFDADPSLGSIWSDRTRIRQILGNLLSNAVKYTERGGVSVRVAQRQASQAPWGGDWITVDVVDTGRGIPEKEQHLVFREFARLEPTTAQGSGLGLAISQWIADALGARITLVSDPGRGSTFTLWLPSASDTIGPTAS